MRHIHNIVHVHIDMYTLHFICTVHFSVYNTIVYINIIRIPSPSTYMYIYVKIGITVHVHTCIEYV